MVLKYNNSAGCGYIFFQAKTKFKLTPVKMSNMLIGQMAQISIAT